MCRRHLDRLGAENQGDGIIVGGEQLEGRHVRKRALRGRAAQTWNSEAAVAHALLVFEQLMFDILAADLLSVILLRLPVRASSFPEESRAVLPHHGAAATSP